MQQDENLVYINIGQQIDEVHMGYRQTGAVYTRRSGLLEVTPDRTPIRPRTRIGSNSTNSTYPIVLIFEFLISHMKSQGQR